MFCDKQGRSTIKHRKNWQLFAFIFFGKILIYKWEGVPSPPLGLNIHKVCRMLNPVEERRGGRSFSIPTRCNSTLSLQKPLITGGNKKYKKYTKNKKIQNTKNTQNTKKGRTSFSFHQGVTLQSISCCIK